MLAGLTMLLIFQLLGEVIAYFTAAVVPGPVIGMAMIALFLTLTRNRRLLGPLGAQTVSAARAVLSHLGLLFVPAGVGIIQHFDLIRQHGAALLAVIAGTTVVTLLVTVATFLAVKRLTGEKHHD